MRAMAFLVVGLLANAGVPVEARTLPQPACHSAKLKPKPANPLVCFRYLNTKQGLTAPAFSESHKCVLPQGRHVQVHVLV